jgi:hypothetical protein
VRENLKFLVEAGLLPDYADTITGYLKANPDVAPQVGSSERSDLPHDVAVLFTSPEGISLPIYSKLRGATKDGRLNSSEIQEILRDGPCDQRRALNYFERRMFGDPSSSRAPLPCIPLIDGMTVAIKGKRRARSTSVTGRLGCRSWHRQWARTGRHRLFTGVPSPG